MFWKLYALTAPLLLVVDAVWLSVVARGFYRREMGGLLRDDVRIDVAVLFYMLYAVGIVVFAVMPGLERGAAVRAMLLGGLLGFLAYAAYDLTNLATLRGFGVRMAIVDMAWGTVLSAGVAGAVTALARALHLGCRGQRPKPAPVFLKNAASAAYGAVSASMRAISLGGRGANSVAIRTFSSSCATSSQPMMTVLTGSVST